MPATKYKSNNAYAVDCGAYSRTYSRARSGYRYSYTPTPTAAPKTRAASPSAGTAVRPAAPKNIEKPAAPRLTAAQLREARREKTKTVLKCAVIIVLAIFMLYRYMLISESGAEINTLQSEYSGLNATAQELQSNIDKSIDLDELEQRAEDDLGMVRPDNNQIFYVDMSGEDYGESVVSEKKSESISGASGSMIRAIDMIK